MAKMDIIRQLTDFFQREGIRQVVILTDENVERHYAGYFADLQRDYFTDKIVIPAGEKSKSIDTAVSIWNYFADKQYDRNIFLLNFGGGTVCDLGGFVASTYKRGIRFANCPTTLLAMIDAAVGGKTGVNLHHLKNAVGTFYFPDIQLSADVSLLETLPQEEMLSGFGELVKYALIGSAELFQELSQAKEFPIIKQEYVDFCVKFKQEVVEKDPKDCGFRHILNFGHTFGHAIESHGAEIGRPFAHGVAVAQGLYYESLLSAKLGHLSQEEWKQIDVFLNKHFDIMTITDETLEKLMPYMLNDKKNRNCLINFTFIDHIGHATPDFQISSFDALGVCDTGVCDTPQQ